MLKIGTGGGVAPVPPTPVPLTIPGLLWWLRGDLGVAPATGNAAVWADQSGSGDPNRDVIQFSAPAQPTIVPSSAPFNGQQVLSFTTQGSQTMAMRGLWSVAPVVQPYTLIVVGSDAASGSEIFLKQDGANNWYVAALSGVYGSSVGVNFLGTTADSTTPKILYMEYDDPAASTIRVSEATPEATGNAAAGDLPQMDVSGTNLTGIIAEVLGYSRLLTLLERTSLLSYLSTRYAIPVGP